VNDTPRYFDLSVHLNDTPIILDKYFEDGLESPTKVRSPEICGFRVVFYQHPVVMWWLWHPAGSPVQEVGSIDHGGDGNKAENRTSVFILEEVS
jgi:hypothetical protein